jgi:hypothetical protein
MLTLVFVSANALAAWTMSVPAQEDVTSRPSQAHHCDSTSTSEIEHASAKSHGSSCPCCHEGCLCFHACGGALTEILVLKSAAPNVVVSTFRSVSPPVLPTGELLRPPIA